MFMYVIFFFFKEIRFIQRQSNIREGYSTTPQQVYHCVPVIHSILRSKAICAERQWYVKTARCTNSKLKLIKDEHQTDVKYYSVIQLRIV